MATSVSLSGNPLSPILTGSHICEFLNHETVFLRQMWDAAYIPVHRRRLDRRHHWEFHRPQDVPPTLSFGIESRLGWLDQIDSLPGSTTESGMSSERKLKYVNYQHPNHDSTPDWTSPDSKSS